ncbi:hypothetical protein EKO04_008658 [Ascochyta lentis]|uniref:Uncharacterized protein n=1 Tax=Ascochyta lentis TaxID=205686 RepID=A0A8H7J014_9PLEO|nr:hypothetical protein EKO04_008658 [Ascochyta lentis]
MFSNSALLLFWSVTFALLTWWSSGTLTHACNKQNWRSSVGINVCRSFKALFTFTCVGLASTGLATYLDFRIYRKSTRLGKYGQMQAEDKLQDDDQKAGLDVSDALLAPRKAYQRESSFTKEDD